MEPHVAIMTGGTSGLGAHAAAILDASFDLLLLGKRSPGPSKVGRALPLDLADLASVRRFCADVGQALQGRPIDLLVLNAGGNFPFEKTSDGFERNFAVNHLAHYLLLRLLLPSLATKARIVITTSGTHDPREKTPVPPPRHADARRLAYPEDDPERDDALSVAAGRAYSSAKLCNLLTAQALARLPEVTDAGIDVVAFSPGPTPGTGLVSARSVWLGVAFRYILPLMAPFSSKLNTPEMAGAALADVALGRVRPPEGAIYALLRDRDITFPDPSDLAQDETAIAELWVHSAELLRIPSTGLVR